MEEKESTISGSLGNSESDSPIPSVSNSMPQMAVNMNVETSIGATTTITPGSTGGGGQGSFDLFGKKKRGRPRKYDSDGNLNLAYQKVTPPPPGFSLSPTSPSEFSSKRGRGRPSGSGNWQLLASLGELFANTAGGDFTPHVVTVNTGEDVAGKIQSFAQKGPRGVCVLSANGAVSNVTIRQPGSSGGILTYEGRFEILSLSGSFTVMDTNGARNRTGGLSVSLAGPDGRVIGGGIAGLLTAAGPIQIVVGSFTPNVYKAHKRKHHREHTVASPIPGAPDSFITARPISQAKPDSENCLNPTPILPENCHKETDDITIHKQNSDATLNTADWDGSEVILNQRPSPDINVSLLGE